MQSCWSEPWTSCLGCPDVASAPNVDQSGRTVRSIRIRSRPPRTEDERPRPFIGGPSRSTPGGSREAHISTECPEAGEKARVSASHVDQIGSGDHTGAPPAGSRPAVSLIDRVHGRAAFVDLRRHGRRVRRGPISIVFLPVDDGRVRVAYALPKRIGNAVVRNRIRRRVRAAFAHIDATRHVPLSPGRYLVTAEASIADRSFASVITALEQVLALVPAEIR